MASGKYINTNWRVVVDEKELSDHAFDVQIADEKAQIDVSGFGGKAEELDGLRTTGVTVSFLNDFGTASVFGVLQPLYSSGTSFPFYVQPFSNGGTAGAEDPVYGGTAKLSTFPVSATLNERGEIVCTFGPYPGGGGFDWGTAIVGTV